MSNHQLNVVRQQMNNIVIKIASVNLNIEKGNFVFSLFLLLASVNNRSNPKIPVEIIHNVELSPDVRILYFFNIVIAKIFVVTHKAVGSDFETTFFKKLLFICSLLGSNAKTNEGIPIVTVLIKLS